MALYRTTFDIDASPERVWDVLTDFEAYGDWNPALPRISGELRAGAPVALRLAMPGRPSINAKAVLGDVEPQRKLTWSGHVGARWFFRGYREFALEPAEGRTRFTHVEDVKGAIMPLFGLVMGGALQRGHDAFNEAIARRASRA